MTNEERQAKIAEIEGRAEQYARSARVSSDPRFATLLEDMAWLVGQIGEVRADTISEAVGVVNQAREDEETDLRAVRSRIEGLAA